MHGASFALLVLAAVAAMATPPPPADGPILIGRTRPNSRNPQGKAYRKSLVEAERRAGEPLLPSTTTTSGTVMTDNELGLNLSGLVTTEIVSPSLAAAAAEGDAHEAAMVAGIEASREEEEQEGEASETEEDEETEDEENPIPEQPTLTAKERQQQAAMLAKKSFEGEDKFARPPRTILVLRDVEDAAILSSGMRFDSRADAELAVAELSEKRRHCYRM